MSSVFLSRSLTFNERMFLSGADFVSTKNYYHNKALCLFHLEKYPESEALFLKNIELEKQNKDSLGLAISYMNLANQYYNQFLDDKAIPYFKLSLLCAKNAGDLSVLKNAYLNAAVVVQTSENSCGAFALAAVLDHLGRANYILDTNNLANGFTAPGAGPAAFAESIYQVTGCLNLGVASATYQYQEPVADRNPPSALAYMAVRHGVDPANILTRYNNAALASLQVINVTNPGHGPNLLDTEIRLIDPPALGNVVGPTNYIAQPVEGEAHLLLVNDNSHWIAINSQQLYDPATGFVVPYMAAPGFTEFFYIIDGVRTLFPFNGIWLQLS